MSNYYNRQWRLPNNENKDKQSNYSMDFDGSIYIDAGTGLGDSLGGSYSGDLTVSMWLKFDSTSTQYGLFYIGDLAGGSGSFWINTSASKLWVYANNGTAGYINCSISSLNTTDWYNVICVYKGYDISNSKIYINNVSQTLTTSGNFNYTYDFTSKKTAIGDYYTTPPFRGFNGKIDGVSIFNYALSSSQVTTLYGSSSTGIGNPMSLSPAPVAYYPLGDQDAFNGSNYLVPNSSLKDYVFSFDGTNDYINFGNDSSLQPANAISISAWVNFSTVVNYGAILFTGNGNGNSGCYLLTVVSNKFYFYIRNTSWVYVEATGFTITTGTWIHLVATYDKQNLKLYVNNSSPYTQSETNSILYGASSSTKIGTYNNNYFNGSISNAQIFNTALPATGSNSVETLYNNGSPLTSMTGFTSLVSWYKLNASDTYDGTNWTIEDHAGSSDGTSSGMTQSALQQSDLSFKTSISEFALDFDGANDYIDLTNQIVLSSELTISCWVKSDGAVVYGITARDNGSADSWYRFYPTASGGNTLNIMIDGGTTDWIFANGGTPIQNGVWQHYLLKRDSSNIWTFYLDNVKYTTNQPTISGSFRVDTFCRVYSSSPRYFNGAMSNMAIWNTSLSDSQVTEIYNQGLPSNLNSFSGTAPIHWYQLGSNSSFNTNWTVLDEKGSNNGTSSNMTEDAIVDGVGSYANGTSSGMGGDEVVGDAPYSTANSLSVNMDVEDRVSDTPS